MLLYAKTTESAEINRTYRMSGNTIDVRTLDLNCDFYGIAQQLNRIASDYFGS
jgi:5-methylcytosine-specific restriction enzyme subunit McrC